LEGTVEALKAGSHFYLFVKNHFLIDAKLLLGMYVHKRKSQKRLLLKLAYIYRYSSEYISMYKELLSPPFKNAKFLKNKFLV
jgi:hypothetical protein